LRANSAALPANASFCVMPRDQRLRLRQTDLTCLETQHVDAAQALLVLRLVGVALDILHRQAMDAVAGLTDLGVGLLNRLPKAGHGRAGARTRLFERTRAGREAGSIHIGADAQSAEFDGHWTFKGRLLS
jgi:hypothetical protein